MCKRNEIPEVIRAKSFELMDDNNKVRTRLSLDKRGQPVFDMLDSLGKPRLKIYAEENDEAGILLYDRYGQLRFSIFEHSYGGSVFQMGVSGGRGAIEAYVTEDEFVSPSFTLRFENGEIDMGSLVGSDSVFSKEQPYPRLDIRDENGGVRAYVEEGKPHFSLNDHNNWRRVRVDVNEEGSPSLSMSDKSGNERVRVEIKPDGSPLITLLDDEGNADNVDLL